MKQQVRICFVTAGGDHPWIMANALIDRFGEDVAVIQEEPESKRQLLAARARRFGKVNALGQLATMIVIRLGKRLQAGRVRRFLESEGLNAAQPDTPEIVRVPSVNDADFLKAINRIQPDLVVLAGCRMMRGAMFRQMPCPVINYHAGVTPKYRGMNGGYWSRANGDWDQFGGTIHLIDEGVDTGNVLRHALCYPRPGDTIMTDTYTIAAASRRALVQVVDDMLTGNAKAIRTKGPSEQWFHPTIWQYIWTGLRRGVW